MPFLDAGALTADPDGLAYLKATIGQGGAMPDLSVFTPPCRARAEAVPSEIERDVGRPLSPERDRARELA